MYIDSKNDNKYKNKRTEIKKENKYIKKKTEKLLNVNRKVKKKRHNDAIIETDAEEKNNNNNNTIEEILDVDKENNYILNLNETKKPTFLKYNSYTNEADEFYNLLKNPHLFSFKNSSGDKVNKDKSDVVELEGEINKKGVIKNIKDNIKLDNVIFDTSKINQEENFKEDEELFMFYSTKPCSNDVQERANIV